jgi:hypothetical protein
MNNTELDSILKKARLPKIPEDSLEIFPRHVTSRLRRNERLPRPAGRLAPRLAWTFALEKEKEKGSIHSSGRFPNPAVEHEPGRGQCRKAE